MSRLNVTRRRPVLLAVAGGTALLAILLAFLVALPARSVSGQVLDALTGQPLDGATIKLDGRESRTGPDGAFSIEGARFGSFFEVASSGYNPSAATVGMDARISVLLSPRVLEGIVLDSATSKPIPGALVSAGPLEVTSDGQGRFRLVRIEPGARVRVLAAGYDRGEQVYEGQRTADFSLKPVVLNVKVLDLYTGRPVQGAEVTDGRATSVTDAAGLASLAYLRTGAEVSVMMDGFAQAKIGFTGQEASEIRLRPDTLIGIVKDQAGAPVAGATVTDGRSTVTTDPRGAYRLTGVPEDARLIVRAGGYERKQVDAGRNTALDITLKRFAVRGTYLTFYGVGDEGLRGRMLDLAETTEINAVVVDVKGDHGWLAYESSVPLVKEIGAQNGTMIPDPKKFLADLKSRGIYSIARIVAFKDRPLASARPDLAVVNAATGRPWVDSEGLYWTDATREEVWDYNIALAVEAIRNGFDEVQFDYVRFPSDPSAGNSLDSIRFSKPNTVDNRLAAINGFLEKAASAIHAAGGAVSADVFGYAVWREDDMGIGQDLEEIARRVDYVSPMVYPNLFWDGIAVDGAMRYGGRKSGLYPYEVVSESMKMAVRRVGAAKIRPWLQYYDDYITGKGYGADEVRLQKKATYEAGVEAWLFWDPSNRFAKGGFEPE